MIEVSKEIIDTTKGYQNLILRKEDEKETSSRLHLPAIKMML